MRIALAIPLLLLGACQVSKDSTNNTVSVTYNQDVAENAAADVANTAENIAADIGNEVEDTANKVENRTDDNRDANASENRQ